MEKHDRELYFVGVQVGLLCHINYDQTSSNCTFTFALAHYASSLNETADMFPNATYKHYSNPDSGP